MHPTNNGKDTRGTADHDLTGNGLLLVVDAELLE